MDYKPSASLNNACERAYIYARIRSFFLQQGVLEVETPLLSHSSVTDVYLQSVTAQFHEKDKAVTGYLHTSPEFAMKRLLASWKMPIYQLTKVFRDNEIGNKHNIEFTMLEWYRPQGTLDELIKELNALVNEVLQTKTMFERISYKQAFLDYALVNPFTASLDDLEQTAHYFGIKTSLYRDEERINYMAHKTRTVTNFDVDALLKTLNGTSTNDTYGYTIDKPKTNANISLTMEIDAVESDSVSELLANDAEQETATPIEASMDINNATVDELKEAWLDILYSHIVEPKLGQTVPTVVYDFPATQASLAQVAKDNEGNLVAKRFELYIDGLEIANAYDELADSEEQRIRFELDNEARAEKGLPTIPIDEKLLQGLDDMPDSVGIAVGIDRLVMLACNTNNIADVINFTTENS